MIDLLLLAADDPHAVASAIPVPNGVASTASWAGWILWLPAIAAVLCGLCAATRNKTKLPAWLTVGCLGASFGVTLALFLGYTEPLNIKLFQWIDLHWGSAETGRSFVADFGLYVDQLTLLWMLFVTGLGTLIALYASEYMEPDVGKGYSRFFGGVSIFLFAMSALVMGDNLIMLYLGWEGVGFASYLLIGYYYKKPSAVAAAKKAFIVNRIGDLGLALGVYLTWSAFGTVEYAELFTAINEHKEAGSAGSWTITAIPYLLMLGAFGKSAQLPLYVWLPDAMEGPTPVSALIHAATMVTAGVYLIARMMPMFLLTPESLHVVAWVGGLTALVAATIGMAQYDIKRIMAYSTVSQLGYMFLGLGLMTTWGACYHVFTHAFFKAVLFLTCGAIMHGFAGQLDLRKLSGLRQIPGWRIVSYTMLYGCLCLVGFPFVTSGFFSKDMIMAEAFIAHGPGFFALGIIALLTALLTAYYTFRVWFRVCAGPVQFEMGDDHHDDDDHGHADDHDHHGHDKPHAPRFAINFVLVAITFGAAAAILLKGWVGDMVHDSSAALPVAHAGDGFMSDPHKWMPVVASITTLVGIGIAAWFHLVKREAADSLRAKMLASPVTRWLPIAMENKWYVDEIYHATIRAPLWILGVLLSLIDKYVVDGVIVDGIAGLPRWFARGFQPLHNGILQGYAVSMAGGVGLVAVLVLYMPDILAWLGVGGGV